MAWRGVGNAAWSLTILSVLAGLGFGLPAVNAAIPAARQLAADQPYPLGNGATVRPPPGPAPDVTRSGRGTTLFVRGGVRYQLVVAPFPGSLDEAVARLRHKITANRGYQVTGAETTVRTDQGVTGRQGGYTSPGRDGRYAVLLTRGICVEGTIAGAHPDPRAS